MNENTKLSFLKFLDAVDRGALSISSVSGTDAYGQLIEASESLRRALKEETTPVSGSKGDE